VAAYFDASTCLKLVLEELMYTRVSNNLKGEAGI